MAYRALKSFTGLLSMVKGEVRDIDDADLAKDLIKCGAVVDLSAKQKAAKSSTKSSKKKEEESNVDSDL